MDREEFRRREIENGDLVMLVHKTSQTINFRVGLFFESKGREYFSVSPGINHLGELINPGNAIGIEYSRVLYIEKILPQRDVLEKYEKELTKKLFPLIKQS